MRRRGARDDRGAAAVEAALVICFVLVPLIMGIITYGFLLSFRQSVSQAAAEGARVIAVAPVNADRPALAREAISRVLGETCGSGQLTCTVAPDAACATCFAVTVEWDYATDSTKPKLIPSTMVPATLRYTAVTEVNQ